MIEQEIKQTVEDYFNEMLAKDADYLDLVTDSWIYDAEDWFLNLLSQKGTNRFILNKKECDYQEELVDLVHIFREIALKRFEELYDEKYGERDSLYELYKIVCDVKQMNKTFERVKHHFKKFNAYTNAISGQFEELVKNLQLLDDIENDRVESLKTEK